jgi:hypothetical protein
MLLLIGIVMTIACPPVGVVILLFCALTEKKD